MSVAFRRDSDEEHLEPKFELPVPPGPNLVTPRGLALIEQRIAQLKEDLIAATDETAKAGIKRDLRYWQFRRTTAEVVPHSPAQQVAFGTEVSILMNGEPRTFRIVGDDEADRASGMISFKSPLCRAMLEAEIGDVLPFGGVAGTIEILGIASLDASTLVDGKGTV
jgi:transcription elongation GreA/GreB family factor